MSSREQTWGVWHGHPGSSSGKGDEHQAVYGGLTYRIYGDKFKVMSGVEYSDMSGGDDGGSFNGWTWVSAVRLSF